MYCSMENTIKCCLYVMSSTVFFFSLRIDFYYFICKRELNGIARPHETYYLEVFLLLFFY